MPQHEAGQIVQRMVTDRAIEVHCPQRGAGAGRNVADQEGGMREIELQVERVVLIGGDHQRRNESHSDGHGEIRRRAFGVLYLNLIRRDRRPGRRGEARLRIGSHHQRHIAGIGADGQHRRRYRCPTGTLTLPRISAI